MVLSSYDREWLQHILIDLFNWDLLFPFKHPVDPKRDGVEDYFKFVKKPMDLSTMMKKLNEDKYQSVDEFSEDIRLIYSNALTYHKKDSIITIIASDMNKWYNDRLNSKGGNKELEWKEKIHAAVEKLQEHMQMDPTKRMPPKCIGE